MHRLKSWERARRSWADFIQAVEEGDGKKLVWLARNNKHNELKNVLPIGRYSSEWKPSLQRLQTSLVIFSFFINCYSPENESSNHYNGEDNINNDIGC